MPPTGYSEDALIEQPAIALLGELGWETVNAYGEFDSGRSTLGRDSMGEVVLLQRRVLAKYQYDPDEIL